MVAPELGRTFWTMIDTIQNFVNGEQATWLDKLTEHFPKIEEAKKWSIGKFKKCHRYKKHQSKYCCI